MRIGFCGAHRTGKSTLAEAVADKLGLELLPNPNTAVARGVDMATVNRIEDREGFDLQRAIMRGMLERLVGDNHVADRTPIDAAAYLFADATAGVGLDWQHEEALQYMDQAVRETFQRFDLIVLVPPAIAVEPHPEKPPVNAAYQAHIHMLCRSMLLEREEWLATAVELPVDVLDINERVTFVEAHIREAATNRKLRMGFGTTRIF